MSKHPPTLADACVATALDKRMAGGTGVKNVAVRKILLQVVNARKFVLDPAMSRFLAELAANFWKGGLRKRIRMLENARRLSRAPHALTWIEFSYHADYLQRIIELKDQGIVDFYGNNPARVGWLVQQHPHNDAAFAVNEIRASVNIPDRVFLHPLGSAWCTDDNPSPWHRFPLPDISTSAAVTWMDGYDTPQAHWHAGALGEILTAELLNTMTETLDKHDDNAIRAATQPAIALRTLWALLATINDLPVKIEFVEPSKGYVARGSYKKFLKHSVIHLTVPETRWRKLVLKSAAILRRRAHQVRGHWRVDWRARPVKMCEHDWDETMICRRCHGHQLWIPEHQRGDASMGFVTHDYVVERQKNGPQT